MDRDVGRLTASPSGESRAVRGKAIPLRYIAFLRGINLGRRRLPMSRLKAHFGELGFEQIETFIASGNVLFTSRPTEVGRLESRIAIDGSFSA